MFCDNCGRSVADNSIVCNFCGQPFAAVGGHASGAPSSTGGGRPAGHAQALLVFPPSSKILGALERGSVIRKVIATALRIIGVLIVLGGIYGLVQILKSSFQLSTQGTLGGLILAVIFVAGIVGMHQICFYRACSVDRLKESPFPVMSVFSVLFRASGETYVVLLTAVGLGGCLFIWFSGMNPMMLLNQLAPFLPSMSTGNATFLDGLEFLVELAVAGFVSLVFFYFLAELVLVLADIAKNVRILAKAGE